MDEDHIKTTIDENGKKSPAVKMRSMRILAYRVLLFNMRKRKGMKRKLSFQPFFP